MITMSQIAAEAKLSRYTVSKILNGDLTVKEASRKAVMELCERYGYVPDNAAVNLVRGKSDTIAMIVPYITDDFYNEIIELAEGFAEQRGYRLVYKSSYNDAVKESNIIKTFLALKVCAMIIVPVVREPDARMHSLASKQIPLVYLDRLLAKDSFSVLNDNEGSASMMTSHLLGRGIQRVAYLDSFYGASNPTSLARRQGYAKTMECNGLAPLFIPSSASLEQQDNEKFGYECMSSALKKGLRMEAVFCITDAVALGAMKAISEAGLKPGSDILVAGHDNLRFSAYANPSITTMKQPKILMSQKAVEIADLLVKKQEVDGKCHIFSSELVARESA